MKFGIFYEHQLPRPWREGDELRLFQEALDQVELADRLGIDYAWEVEHHFLEEYSHSAAPEVFLAACSQRTRRIRLGHGIVLMPPRLQLPGAHRLAHRDPRSRLERPRRLRHRRVRVAHGARGLRDRPEARSARCGARPPSRSATCSRWTPTRASQGEYFSMPCRNLVPKPVQKPHPPLWLACSNRETIHLAAQLGVGALTFAFVDPAEAPTG